MSRNIQKEITDRILAKLAAGTIPWRKPWNTTGAGFGAMPRNAVTNRPYSGANTVLLWMEAEEKSYSNPLWLTYKQAQAEGGNVRKGEKGVQIIFWSSFTKTGESEGDADKPKTGMFLKTYTVFNLAQCDGCDHLIDKPVKVYNREERDETAEAFIQSTGASVRHGESRAYYATSGDYINLPAFEAFTGADEYYSTAFHELTHWTGAEHRLNRTFGKRFADSTYAAEELVAELGSAFLCAEFGFDSTLDNSASYIDYWSKTLQDNDGLFISAASKASKAVEYMRELTIAADLPLAAE